MLVRGFLQGEKFARVKIVDNVNHLKNQQVTKYFPFDQLFELIPAPSVVTSLKVLVQHTNRVIKQCMRTESHDKTLANFVI